MFDLASAEPEVCPYLGLPDDPRTRFTLADPAQRCHVKAKPIAIDLGHQAAYCLTADHRACNRFRARRVAGRRGSGLASTVGPSLAPAVGVTAPSFRDNRQGEGGRDRVRTLRGVGSLVAVLAVVAVVGASQAGVIGGSPADGGPSGAVASPAGAAPPAAMPVTTTPTAGSPSAPGPTAKPVATRSPRAAPIIHVVVRGENLISIAGYYGVTVKAIQDANGIRDPSLIRIGDRLVIPPPP